jgi:HK97 family phage major capsid protein
VKRKETQAERIAETLRLKADTSAKMFQADKLRDHTTATRGRLKMREREAYGPSSPHSYFRDLVAVAYAERLSAEAEMAGLTRTRIWPEIFGTWSEGGHQGGADEARRRLLTVERRDVSTADPGAGVFVPPSGSMPAYLANDFAEAARSQATLLALFPNRPLPEFGMDVTVPRLDTGVAVAVQSSEGSTPTEANLDGGSQASKVAYITGKVEASIQAVDRAEPGFDSIIAQDAGRALGAELCNQLVVGTNANGQLLGLITVTNIKTVTATDASPTTQEIIAKLWAGYDQIATSGYGVADPDQYATVVHPRRLAYFFNNAQNSQTVDPKVPGRLVPSAALRTTLGAGTNEDEAFVLLPSELPVYLDTPRIIVDTEGMANTMQVRYIPLQPAATGFGRTPSAICRISGTAFVAPSL